MTIQIIVGDCREVMATMDADSVDAVVTDPPYGLEFMGKEWDKLGATNAAQLDVKGWTNGSGPFVDGAKAPFGGSGQRIRYGASAKTMQDWHETWASEAYRVLKPGGHLLAFGGTRTSHRMVCAIEDAGFEIRDSIVWVYGSGFPKSLDVGKAMDKAANAEREIVGRKQKTYLDSPHPGGRPDSRYTKGNGYEGFREDGNITAPATDLARQWDGWGTALKPAHEPIVVARKPLIGTVAANVERYGTGALNIDASRIGYQPGGRPSDSCWSKNARRGDKSGAQVYGEYANENATIAEREHPDGRWPANVILSHSPDCREVGTKRVKGESGGTNGVQSAAGRIYDHGLDRRERTRTNLSYADADGMETVTAWECVDGCPVAMLDAQSGERKAGSPKTGKEPHAAAFSGNLYGAAAKEGVAWAGYQDRGGASRFFLNVSWQPGELDEARFFYAAKASRRERNAGLAGMPEKSVNRCGETGQGSTPQQTPRVTRVESNDHPTIKPVALMRYLVRLVTPPGGVCLDPFMGGGTTGMACVLEGFDFIGIEQDAHYANDIAAHRIAHVERHGERWLDAKSVRDEPRHIVPSKGTPTMKTLPLFATKEAS